MPILLNSEFLPTINRKRLISRRRYWGVGMRKMIRSKGSRAGAYLVVDGQRVNERLEACRLLFGGEVDDGKKLRVVLAKEEWLGQLAQEQLEEAGDVVRILVLLKVELAGCAGAYR